MQVLNGAGLFVTSPNADCLEARQMLDAYSAFWQDNGRLQGRYELLYSEAEAQCGGKKQ